MPTDEMDTAFIAYCSNDIRILRGMLRTARECALQSRGRDGAAVANCDRIVLQLRALARVRWTLRRGLIYVAAR